MILFNFKDNHFYDEDVKLQEQANLEQQLKAYTHNYENLKEMYTCLSRDFANLNFENHGLKEENYHLKQEAEENKKLRILKRDLEHKYAEMQVLYNELLSKIN